MGGSQIQTTPKANLAVKRRISQFLLDKRLTIESYMC